MQSKNKSTPEQLLTVAEMQLNIEEAEDILSALHAGHIDAVIVAAPEGEKVYTFQSADHHYRLLVEAMNEGAVIMTGGGIVLYSNKSFAEMLNAPMEQITGCSIRQFIVEADIPHYEEMIVQSQRLGSGKGEISLKAADGSLIPVYLSLSVLQLDETWSVCAVITDLTQHKHTQELIASEVLERTLRAEAEASRQRIANILESITDSFFAVDRDWRITDINQRAANFLGRPREELMGRALWELYTEAESKGFYEQYHRAMAERVPVHLESIADAVAGKWFEAHVYPFDKGLSVYLRDITGRKQAEQEREQLLAREQEARKLAEEANRVKDDFLATLSHELRTPLNAILGWTELLSANDCDTAFLEHAIAVITRNAKAQSQLIEDILDVSRIIAGKFHLNKRAAEIAPIIKNAIESIRPAADAKHVRLTTFIDDQVGVVSCDAVRLEQVFWNLLANAIKFTPESGQVEVRLERVDSDAQIIVKDSGEGISAEFLPYVFDRFRQKDSTYARKHSGLGLGLAIARHVVELHGGAIEAYSVGQGHGATFTVKLPLTAEGAQAVTSRQKQAVAHAQATDQAAPRLAGLQVLVVEDDSDTREAIKLILESEGALVKIAARVKEALKQLESWQPDVLMSDIGMPEEDGYALIQQVRMLPPEKGGQVPAIALSGYVGIQEGERALAAGYQVYLAKPTQLEDLMRAITSLASRNRRRSS